MDKPYVIRVSSQKGGVGKTTVAVNLAVAFAHKGYKTLLIDADAANPSVALHLGFEDQSVGYLDVVNGNARLQDATVMHAKSGLHVLPGKVVTEAVAHDKAHADHFMPQVNKQGFDFVVIDTAPGIQMSGLGYDADYGLIVTFPFVASCASAIRLAQIFDRYKVRHGLVVNKFGKRRYELDIREIEEMYEGKVHIVFPDDEIVPKSIESSIPAYVYKRRSGFSRRIDVLALSIIKSSGKGTGTEKDIVANTPIWRRFLDR